MEYCRYFYEWDGSLNWSGVSGLVQLLLANGAPRAEAFASIPSRVHFCCQHRSGPIAEDLRPPLRERPAQFYSVEDFERLGEFPDGEHGLIWTLIGYEEGIRFFLDCNT